MSGDVYVSFGADTGELEGAFTLARAEAQNFQRQMAAVAREMAKTGMSADSELGKHLNELAAQFRAKSHMAEFSAEMRKHTQAATEAGVSLEQLGDLGEYAKRDSSLPGSPSASKRSRNGSPRPRKRPRSSNG